jgi:Fe-S-cluster containining protein
MRNGGHFPGVRKVNKPQDLPAGGFSSWLRRTRRALRIEGGTRVDCGGCSVCCSSSYFIHIRPEETRTLGRIPKGLLAKAPGLPKGNVVLGYDQNGRCPMLTGGGCSIYARRPLTCRMYDCRVFAAAGIAAGGEDKAGITRRAGRWKFSYPTRLDRDEHAAVKAAATFIQEHAKCFPREALPGNPSQLAILAIKAYDVFLKKDGRAAGSERISTDVEVAQAIVQASRKFEVVRNGKEKRVKSPARPEI